MFAKAAFLNHGVHAFYVTMARFLVGLVLVGPLLARDRTALRMVRPIWVTTRSITNVCAVLLFFLAIQHTTVSNANLLNMTYPLFVFLFAPIVTSERNGTLRYVALGITLIGAWNVVRPENLTGLSSFALGDTLAFASAITAGFSIATLRRARAHDTSITIVFYVMLVGIVINLFLLPFVPRPDLAGFGLALTAGTFGAIGQFLLTSGFRHVSASIGALLSTARIPIAAGLGIVLFGDPITVRSALGTLLIVFSLIVTAYERPRRPRIT